MRPSGLLLPLLLAALLAPSAAADHVFSHRYQFEGRLVGADHLPLPGRTVTFHAEGDDFLTPCADQPQKSVTDEWGDFRFCFHKHDLDTRIRVGVRVGNVTVERPVDTAFRRTIVTLREPNETGVAPPGWDETYRIAGRAWSAGVTTLEGVKVFGLAVPNAPVNVTVVTPEGETEFATTTDAFGDFDIEVVTAEAPQNVTVRMEALGSLQTARLNGVTHRTTAPIYVEPHDGGGDIGASFPQARVESVPGTSDPPASPGLVSGVTLAILGAIWLARRKKDS